MATYDLSFIDIYCGWPGSVHDARVLRESPLFDNAESDPMDLFPENRYLLGDSAYPLLPWLLVPFKDYGYLGHKQRRYNARQSGSRQVVENAFGLLKGRFRQLRCLDMQIEFVPSFVTACCVLHNICLKNNESGEEFFSVDEDFDIPAVDSNCFVNSVTATNKRESIAQKLME